MSRINSRLIWIYFNLILISILIMTCKKDNNDCSSNKYYLTFVYNGQRFCNSLCKANIEDSLKQNQSTFYSSDCITFISSGAQNIVNDSIFYNPMIYINFPGKTIGTYNKDSVKGIDYFINFKINNEYYSYPTYDIETLNIKGNFELNILDFNTENNIITGTFKGVLYNNDIIYSKKDSVIITGGEFRGNLIKK